jgi:hypothetical protein
MEFGHGFPEPARRTNLRFHGSPSVFAPQYTVLTLAKVGSQLRSDRSYFRTLNIAMRVLPEFTVFSSVPKKTRLLPLVVPSTHPLPPVIRSPRLAFVPLIVYPLDAISLLLVRGCLFADQPLGHVAENETRIKVQVWWLISVGCRTIEPHTRIIADVARTVKCDRTERTARCAIGRWTSVGANWPSCFCANPNFDNASILKVRCTRRIRRPSSGQSRMEPPR